MKLNGNYEKLTLEEMQKFDNIFETYRSFDTYTFFYHHDIEQYIDSKLLKTIIIYAINYNQDIDVHFKDGELSFMKIGICSDCLASAYADYLGKVYE